MKPEHDDRKLKSLFEQLRAEEQAMVPDFDAMMETAMAEVAQPARKASVFRIYMAAAAMVVVTLGGWSIYRASFPIGTGGDEVVDMFAWEAPSDALLSTEWESVLAEDEDGDSDKESVFTSWTPPTDFFLEFDDSSEGAESQ